MRVRKRILERAAGGVTGSGSSRIVRSGIGALRLSGWRRILTGSAQAYGHRKASRVPPQVPGLPCALVSSDHPSLRQVVLDTTDVRGLAEFYRKLLGYTYRPGDEPPAAGQLDAHGSDWLVLRDGNGQPGIAFQQVDALPAATWPDGDVPQQLHLDLTVPTIEALEDQHSRATALGAQLLLDRSDDSEEPLRVYADPAGHPFCIFVAPA